MDSLTSPATISGFNLSPTVNQIRDSILLNNNRQSPCCVSHN